MSNKKSNNKHCRLCEDFEILRYPASNKVGLAICNHTNMILSFEDVKQFDDLKCEANKVKDRAN